MISNSFFYDVFYVHIKIMLCFSLRKHSWFWLIVRRVFFDSHSFGALALARLLVNDPKKELVEWGGNANSHKHP